jgi:hypothetical protein
MGIMQFKRNWVLPMNLPPDRGRPVRSTEPEVQGHYAVPEELGASHEPSPALALDPGMESKSRSMIKSKTTRFMGIMQFWRELAASHEAVEGREVDG